MPHFIRRIAILLLLAIIGGVAHGLGFSIGESLFDRNPNWSLAVWRIFPTAVAGLIFAPVFIATAYHKHALVTWCLVFIPPAVAGMAWIRISHNDAGWFASFHVLYACALLTFVFLPERGWYRRPGTCLKCGYDLHGTKGDTCPECGAKRRADEVARFADVWRRRLAMWLPCALASGIGHFLFVRFLQSLG